MKSIFKKIIGISLASALCVTLASCKSSSSTDKLDAIKKAGVLVVGTSADYPPFEFHKQQNGQDKIMGADVEIAEQVAKKIGVKIQWQDMDFDGLLPALQAGKIDMIIAGMIDTPEREKAVDFSHKYYLSSDEAIIRKDDLSKYSKLSDLSGKHIGVQLGTTQQDDMKKWLPSGDYVALGKDTDLILELKSKKVDAVILEEPIVKAYVSQNSDLTTANISFPKATQGPAIAVQKGNDKEFLSTINSVVDGLVSSKKVDNWVAQYTTLSEK